MTRCPPACALARLDRAVKEETSLPVRLPLARCSRRFAGYRHEKPRTSRLPVRQPRRNGPTMKLAAHPSCRGVARCWRARNGERSSCSLTIEAVPSPTTRVAAVSDASPRRAFLRNADYAQASKSALAEASKLPRANPRKEGLPTDPAETSASLGPSLARLFTPSGLRLTIAQISFAHVTRPQATSAAAIQDGRNPKWRRSAYGGRSSPVASFWACPRGTAAAAHPGIS